MGKYSDNISERLKHTRIENGYCLICGKFDKLTKDHVPPKGAITITKVEQKHIIEIIGAQSKKIKGVTAQGGSIFRTICNECNAIKIGSNDNELSRIYLELTGRIKSEFYKYNGTPNTITINADLLKYSRAMIGHILAATSVKECLQEPSEIPYFSPMQKFVLGDDNALSKTHDIYYWFYPQKRHLSAKLVNFYNEGSSCLMSLLSFFPLAFLVTEKNKGIVPSYAEKLNLHDATLRLNLLMHKSNYIDFPFHKMTGNQLMLMASHQCIVSYPI